MKLKSNSFTDGVALPSEFAFAVIDENNSVAHIALGQNRNPHLAWSDVPIGTRSFVVICCDRDVPSSGDDVNKEGREVPTSLPRVDFYHWVLLDVDATMREIEAGSHSEKVTARGKSGPAAPGGLRHGINDYTHWFASDETMNGAYYGYDGPCPPWNDTLLHRYVFTVYALDIELLNVKGTLEGANVRAAMEGHVLAQASLTGKYTLNPRLLG
jgi:Raf kinase inhibitor-like YbhB/YbcL family protein